VTGLLVVLAAGCGRGGSSDVTYSATKFSACLTGRDVSPQKMDTSPSAERYINALDRLAGEAARQNGAVQAFGNDALPEASTLYFLFFEDADRAQDGQRQLAKSRVRSTRTTGSSRGATCSRSGPGRLRLRLGSSMSA
jgi:hypothetical protein